MTAVTIVSGVSNPGDVTNIPGISIYHTGVTLVDYNATTAVGGFISLTSSTAGLRVLSIYVDESNNVIIFGDAIGVGALAIKLDSTGALSLSDKITPASNARSTPDGTGNLYATFTNIDSCCYYYPELVKLSSSFVKLAGVYNGYGDGYGGPGQPVVDSSGNIWVNQYDGYCGNALFKFDSALSTITEYYYGDASGYFSINGYAFTSTNNLINIGGYVDYCSYNFVPVAFSVSATNPTGTPNWGITGTVYEGKTFAVVKVDTSNNIYISLVCPTVPTFNTLIKINSSGSLPLAWQYTYTGINGFYNFALDSSNNVYVVGTNNTNGFTIIKVNSSGTLVYSRKLTPAVGYISDFAGTPVITISGNYIYITASYYPPTGVPQVLTIKVPTDGTGTQSISVGGYSFTYAVGTVTASVATESFTTTPISYSGGSIGAVASFTSVSSLTASTAVTVL